MKKVYRTILICMMIILSAFVLAACGKKDAGKKTTTESSTEASEDVASTEDTTEATTEAQVDEEGFTIVNDKVTTTDYVNVRTAPSTDGDPAMQLADGVELDRIGYNDEWSKVSIKGETYYVYSKFVKAEGAASSGDDSSTEESTQETSNVGEGKLICIDAGHQATPNTDTEPVGPGAEDKKAKVSAGNTGVTTGTEEYELNLEVALKLQSALEARGYTVKMIRTSNDVDISNAARAELANSDKADAFIRIHANGSTDTNASGVMTVCQTKDNPYNADIYDSCKRLSADVLSGMAAATGANSEGVWETDSMSGINWCKVPVTIVEIGYMTNSEEDQKLVTSDYQNLLAKGIADGIDAYFAGE
ncbi:MULTISPECIES: N-acetylmuramoyl-L-alanine amidase [Coprococcus]|jgi:N-acetylmuramoyl-L-alanine amidase|uniref:N-acetylmuramoyl-L-alanine amidase n=1 Tax=Coprococcus TaxID=33042 RepID=UPI000821DD60|nr:N-acetylmuramoyl-L-alanine amidase [Coprococcus ammoniilyticus]MCU6730759.1 N-acetylmuramoyl-L-alanine amidase [Coprococcus ammoniilyticus]RGH10023.1 N-acetylmuramoyl-L-alanine amidase [Clostridium sp. AF15-31]RHV80530.1 N-acetylmuramoyl-L-alanine amidase [Clostridium sp. OF10-22XD]SCH70174.1 N-acetylmuramoyl-L-alanine amidase LytC precursor [uncultured Coprococcus sp.]